MSQRLTQSTWSELSVDILVLIYEKLPYDDSVRFTCVCKNWHNFINKGVPWLLLYHSEKEKPWFLVRRCSRIPSNSEKEKPRFRVRHRIPIDILPSLSRIYDNLEEEDFTGINVLASKRGWLLLTDCKRSKFCCYNVFNSDAMRLPGLRNLNECVPMKATFSDVPTRQDSVIFLICQTTQKSVEIKTCHLGAKNWRSDVFSRTQNLPPCQDVVYSKGKFYCIFRVGLVIFDLENHEFHYFEPEIPGLKSPFNTFHLAESDGEILLMLAHQGIPYFPMWKLNLQNMEFLQVEKLGDRAFYTSFGSTSICAKCENESFMDKMFYTGTNYVWFMSLHRRVHNISESYPWIINETTGSKLIWIEPSK